MGEHQFKHPEREPERSEAAQEHADVPAATHALGEQVHELVGDLHTELQQESGTPASGYDATYFETNVTENDSMKGKLPDKADMLISSPRIHDTQLRETLGQLRPRGYYSYASDNTQYDHEQAVLEEITPEHTQEAKRLICDWYRKRYGTEMDPEHVLLCKTTVWGMQACVQEEKKRKESKGILASAWRRLMKPKPTSSVAAIVPAYDPYQRIAERVDNAPLTQIPLLQRDRNDPSAGWKFDVSSFERIIAKAKPATLLLSNPNNPTGYVYSEDELRSIITICKKHNVTLISDEVWADHTDTQHVSAARIAQECGCADTVITAFGTGKTFNTSGFPCNALIIPNATTRGAVKPHFSYLRPRDISVPLLRNCMEQADDYLPPLRSLIRENMQTLAATLETCGMKTHIPDSTFVLFVHLGENAEQSRTLLEEAGIMTKDGADYGTSGKGFVRIVVAAPAEVVRSCCERLKELSHRAGRLT